jgi:predicted aminopeptidase
VPEAEEGPSTRVSVRAGILGVALTATQLGCLHVCYLAQAIAGQDDIAWRARPIERAARDERTPRPTRVLLSLIDEVKQFGEQHGLAPTTSYRDYADLRREAVVWVVSASPPLAFEPRTWWFPIVGSVPYLGWFERRDAERHAAELGASGLDVDLRPSPAYSTLGWFDDPVLSTMIRGEGLGAAASLVNTVLHESVHATHFVAGQAPFNESLASFVADELAPRFLETHVGPLAARVAREREARGRHRQRRFHETYRELVSLYASKLPEERKLAHKRRILDALRAEVRFGRPINNATLAQARTYHGGGAELARLLARCGGDWRRFLGAIKTVDASAFHAPNQSDLAPVVRPLAARGCASAAPVGATRRLPSPSLRHLRQPLRQPHLDERLSSAPGGAVPSGEAGDTFERREARLPAEHAPCLARVIDDVERHEPDHPRRKRRRPMGLDELEGARDHARDASRDRLGEREARRWQAGRARRGLEDLAHARRALAHRVHHVERFAGRLGALRGEQENVDQVVDPDDVERSRAAVDEHRRASLEHAQEARHEVAIVGTVDDRRTHGGHLETERRPATKDELLALGLGGVVGWPRELAGPLLRDAAALGPAVDRDTGELDEALDLRASRGVDEGARALDVHSPKRRGLPVVADVRGHVQGDLCAVRELAEGGVALEPPRHHRDPEIGELARVRAGRVAHEPAQFVAALARHLGEAHPDAARDPRGSDPQGPTRAEG